VEPTGPTVRRGVVNLKPLPAPDQLKTHFPTGHSALVVDDGTVLTEKIVDRFDQIGLTSVVLRLPQAVVSRRRQLSQNVNQIQLVDLSEEQLRGSLEAAARQFGPAAVFIHLQNVCSDCSDEGLQFSKHGKQILQEVFLIAKHLKPSLNNAASQGRAVFMSVVRLDGEFGLGNSTDFDPVSGGLFGLVKSLNLEWDSVFCRAIDLHPDIDSDQAVEYIMNEMMDPNRMVVEVGYSPKGRATLALESAGM
jgi:hypothetical protein